MRGLTVGAALLVAGGMAANADDASVDGLPTAGYVVETYRSMDKGTALYEAGSYGEALEELLVAATRGFKWAQAKVGDIYLHGRGDVERDIARGIVWLGVAAEQRSDPNIRKYFEAAWSEIPEAQHGPLKAFVARYKAEFGSDAHRVKCERIGMRIRRLECRFRDEAAVLPERWVFSNEQETSTFVEVPRHLDGRDPSGDWQ